MRQFVLWAVTAIVLSGNPQARIMVFRRHEDKVQREREGQGLLSPAFVLDQQTLEVK